MNTKVSAEQINADFGISLLAGDNLWNEAASVVAQRLSLPCESLTSYESGYRTYLESQVLEARAFSIFLQGKEGKVANLSILFANKGDVESFASPSDQYGMDRAAEITKKTKIYQAYVSPQMMQAYQTAIRHGQEELRHKLESLFGASRPASLGSTAIMQERGDRWDWHGISFFLAAPQNEYIVLRILPSGDFDSSDTDRAAFQKRKEHLASRVTRRPNGDVIIDDLPMVDQGPKGYCIPATFERVLRYYGLQADMNLLALGGQTQAGGGTWLSTICNAAFLVVNHAGGRVIQGLSSLRITDIAPYIDKGEPVIWTLSSNDEFNQRVNQRMKSRKNVTDWMDWKKNVIDPENAKVAQLSNRFDHHGCLITGYNRQTGELAISDSWGKWYQERWITQGEAAAVSLGAASVIGW